MEQGAHIGAEGELEEVGDVLDVADRWAASGDRSRRRMVDGEASRQPGACTCTTRTREMRVTSWMWSQVAGSSLAVATKDG